MTNTAITLSDTAPRVWIGCLACYNAGRLTGTWVDAHDAEDTTPETIHGRPTAHEELWVMDHDNFQGLATGEFSPAEATRLAELLDEIEASDVPTEAVIAWLDNQHYSPEQASEHLDDIADAYAGHADDLDEFAWDYLEETGMLAELPDWADTHKSALVHSWARDLELGGEVETFAATDGGVHVFFTR